MVMVEFGTSSAFRGWVRVRVLGYGFGVRGRKVKSSDFALASDLAYAFGRFCEIIDDHRRLIDDFKKSSKCICQ